MITHSFGLAEYMEILRNVTCETLFNFSKLFKNHHGLEGKILHVEEYMLQIEIFLININYSRRNTHIKKIFLFPFTPKIHKSFSRSDSLKSNSTVRGACSPDIFPEKLRFYKNVTPKISPIGLLYKKIQIKSE